MENKSHAMAAGAFVLVVTAMLIGLAVWLTRDKGSSHLYELSSHDSVTGLQLQAPVRFRGVSVGKVSYIGFDPDVVGNVLIRITVDDTTPLSPNTVASLNFQGITGLAFVLLDESPRPVPPIPAGASGIPRLPLESSQLAKLADQAPKILSQLDDVSLQLTKLLSDNNQKVLMDVLSNTGALAKDAGQTARSLTRLATGLETALSTQIGPALEQVPALTADTRKAMGSLQGAAEEAQKTLADVDEIVRRLSVKGGAIDRLNDGAAQFGRAAGNFNTITLPRVNNAADQTAATARRLGRTANQINDNPQSLLFGDGALRPGPGESGFVAPEVKP
ncbi:MlaD family protein [Variovorax sp. HJSM1_2]|uniref:MlaD family protein n=1 Tax=Variovorax sp. HJSM1_2 TaxID=3366263 RepID=UPI003BCC0A55